MVEEASFLMTQTSSTNIENEDAQFLYIDMLDPLA